MDEKSSLLSHSNSSSYRQYLSVLVIYLTLVCDGTITSFTATAIRDLQSPDSGFPTITTSEAAWLSSSYTLSAVAGIVIAGCTVQWTGFKRQMLVFAIPTILGWVVILGATKFSSVLLGRSLTGFGGFGMSVCVMSYIAEIADPRKRGALGMLGDTLTSVGELYILAIGALMSWRWQAVACGIIPIVFCICIYHIPESPRQLIAHGKIKEAKESLRWFRSVSSTDLIEDEFRNILREEEYSSLETKSFRIQDCFSPIIFKPAMTCLMLMFFYSATGGAVMTNYTIQIFQEAGVAEPTLNSVIAGLTHVAASAFTIPLVDRAGRRGLLMISSAAMATCMAMLAALLHWQQNMDEEWHWATVVLLMVQIVVSAIGIGSIPFVYLGEVIPQGVKGYISAIVLAACRMFMWVSLYTFENLVDQVGESVCFAFFSASSLTALVYCYYLVPETKHKTLAQIQFSFRNIKSN